jgi:hypothetical protein
MAHFSQLNSKSIPILTAMIIISISEETALKMECAETNQEKVEPLKTPGYILMLSYNDNNKMKYIL